MAGALARRGQFVIVVTLGDQAPEIGAVTGTADDALLLRINQALALFLGIV